VGLLHHAKSGLDQHWEVTLRPPNFNMFVNKTVAFRQFIVKQWLDWNTGLFLHAPAIAFPPSFHALPSPSLPSPIVFFFPPVSLLLFAYSSLPPLEWHSHKFSMGGFESRCLEAMSLNLDSFGINRNEEWVDPQQKLNFTQSECQISQSLLQKNYTVVQVLKIDVSTDGSLTTC